MGFGCFIVLFVLVFVSVLLRTGRRLATKDGRLEFMGYRRARELECPVCQEMVFQHELIKHLIVDHDIEPFEAGEMTGKVMRKPGLRKSNRGIHQPPLVPIYHAYQSCNTRRRHSLRTQHPSIWPRCILDVKNR